MGNKASAPKEAKAHMAKEAARRAEANKARNEYIRTNPSVDPLTMATTEDKAEADEKWNTAPGTSQEQKQNAKPKPVSTPGPNNEESSAAHPTAGILENKKRTPSLLLCQLQNGRGLQTHPASLESLGKNFSCLPLQSQQTAGKAGSREKKADDQRGPRDGVAPQAAADVVGENNNPEEQSTNKSKSNNEKPSDNSPATAPVTLAEDNNNEGTNRKTVLPDRYLGFNEDRLVPWGRVPSPSLAAAAPNDKSLDQRTKCLICEMDIFHVAPKPGWNYIKQPPKNDPFVIAVQAHEAAWHPQEPFAGFQPTKRGDDLYTVYSLASQCLKDSVVTFGEDWWTLQCEKSKSTPRQAQG